MPFSTENSMPVRDTLRSVKFEAMKLYRVYDQTNRLTTQYDAVSAAKDGDACLRTDYVYDSQTTRIVKIKESMAAWSSAWDV